MMVSERPLMLSGTYTNVTDQRLNLLRCTIPESSLNDRLPRGRHHHNYGRIQHSRAGSNGQQNQPEPQENVDLLVQNVQRQHAQRIVLLDAARRSVLVEYALGDARKNLHHRIGSILLVHVREAQHIGAVRHEGTAQETIDQHDVDEYIDEVQSLAEEVPKSVAVVRAQTVVDVLHKASLTLRALRLRRGHDAAQTLGDHAHFAVLPVLPDPVRHIEADALEEQHERHPLIVAVVGFLLVVVAEAALRHLGANDFAVLVRQRESVGDPAVSGENVAGYGSVVNAGDRFACLVCLRRFLIRNGFSLEMVRFSTLTDQIVRRHDYAAHEENRTGQAIVETKHHIVDDGLLDQVAHLHEAGNG